MSSICISAKGSNSISRLELGKNLLHFIEFDFTYFWEQCMDFARMARKSGGFPHKQLSVLKSAVIKSHPYIELMINTAFDHIAMDCIIDYICTSEGISEDELWNRCISPKSLYERSIFNRISEYKTGRGINQWRNIMRMQEYALAKLSYIFDGDPENGSVYRARKEYFDLTFSVAANEMGYDLDSMPCNSCYSPTLLPSAPFMMSGLAKSIVYRMENVIDSAPRVNMRRTKEIMRDKLAMDAFEAIGTLPRASDREIRQAAEVFKAADCLIYLPNGLKAVIDLEFDKMIDDSLFIQKCTSCGKYFHRSYDYTGTLCNRVNASGMSCREQAKIKAQAEAAMLAAVKEGAAESAPAENVRAENVQTSEKSIPATAPVQDKSSQAAPIDDGIITAESLGGYVFPEETAKPSPAPEKAITEEINKRCEEVYAALSSKAGNNQMSLQEFEEWSAYLMNMKKNIEINELTVNELKDFLDYTEQMYSL